MKINIDKKDQFTVITIGEEKLNSLVAPDLKTEVVTLNSEGVNNMVIDLSNVVFADSSGLSALLVANRLCKNNEGTFVIANPQASVQKLIKISQLDSVLKIASNLEEAQGAF